MATLTRTEIEQVLHVPSSPGFILSCYTDLTVKDSFQRHWSDVLKHSAALMSFPVDNFLIHCPRCQSLCQQGNLWEGLLCVPSGINGKSSSLILRVCWTIRMASPY